MEEPGAARLAGRPGGPMAVRRPRRCPRRRPPGRRRANARRHQRRTSTPMPLGLPALDRLTARTANQSECRPEGPEARALGEAAGAAACMRVRRVGRSAAKAWAARKRCSSRCAPAPAGPRSGAKSAARPTVQTLDLWRRRPPPVCARSGPRSSALALSAPPVAARRRDRMPPARKRHGRPHPPVQLFPEPSFASPAAESQHRGIGGRQDRRTGELHPYPTGFKTLLRPATDRPPLSGPGGLLVH